MVPRNIIIIVPAESLGTDGSQQSAVWQRAEYNAGWRYSAGIVGWRIPALERDHYYGGP